MGFIYFSPPSQLALRDSKTSPRPASARVSWCLETSSIKTPFPGGISVPSSFVSLLVFYILSYLLLKTMGCFSARLITSASDQKLFCEVCSAFSCSFDEFVGEKVVSPSYSSTMLAPPEEGFLISPCYSLELAFRWVYLSFSPLPLAVLLFSAICKVSSDSHFAFLHFFSMGMVLIPVSCTVSQTSVHSSSGPLSITSRFYFSLPLYNHKGFDVGHT